MRYRTLGRTGLFVSELCLGTMTFGGSEGFWQQIGALDQDAATGLVRSALDAASTSSTPPMSMPAACRRR
jgi:aryl-alcohol dehydrogenase-like predicted oxidoreductase